MPNFEKLIKRVSYYPPYLGAGISVKHHNEDFTRFEVEMKLAWYNKNLIGTQFGGSLYSMCDPFYMFILMINLGKKYIVWDKSARIEFKKPGRGKVKAIFEISPEEIEKIRLDIEEKTKNTYFFYCDVVDEEGTVIASVEKEVYVRKKDPKAVEEA